MDGITSNKVYTPLCVDLDGTLIKSDVTMACFLEFIRHAPRYFYWPLIWFLRGRAHLKSKLAAVVNIDVQKIPYNEKFVAFLKNQKKLGAEIFLVTACDEKIAVQIANHLGFFDDVMASNGEINLRAGAKAKALIDRFGDKKFTYAGNSYDDIKVWRHSKYVIAVNLSTKAKIFMERTADLYFD
jgi:hypothetical protein